MGDVTSLDEREKAAREQSADNPPSNNGNGHGDPDTIDREDMVLFVSDGKLSGTVGGKKPTDSKFRITGGAIELAGQFDKGDRVRLTVDCRVGGVHVDDRIDPQTREVIATTRKHVLKIEGVELVDGE